MAKKVVKQSKLKDLLTKRKMTAYRLAKILKVQPTQILNWETKVTPSAHYCAKIMSILDCSIWDLLHTYEADGIRLEDDLEAETKRDIERELYELDD